MLTLEGRGGDKDEGEGGGKAEGKNGKADRCGGQNNLEAANMKRESAGK